MSRNICGGDRCVGLVVSKIVFGGDRCVGLVASRNMWWRKECRFGSVKTCVVQIGVEDSVW